MNNLNKIYNTTKMNLLSENGELPAQLRNLSTVYNHLFNTVFTFHLVFLSSR